MRLSLLSALSRRAAALAAVLLVLPSTGLASEEQPLSRPAWSDEILELAATLPIQDGGRVKPLSTFAGFQLLKTNGKRKVVTPDGEELTPTAWLLDCFFYPELARQYETFLVENGEVLVAAGMDLGEKKRRDRWTYDELQPARGGLVRIAQEASHKESKDRTLVERQGYALAVHLNEVDRLIHFLDFARHRFAVGGDEVLRGVWPEDEALSLTEVLAQTGELRTLAFTAQSAGAHGTADFQAADRLLGELSFYLEDGANSLALMPPPADMHPPHVGHEEHEDEGEEEWIAPQEMIGAVFAESSSAAVGLQVLAGFETLVRERDDRPAFEAELRGLHGTLVGLAEERGEYDKIPLEVGFYEVDYFYKALIYFLVAFLLMAFSWLGSGGRLQKLLYWGAWGTSGVATVYLVAGIVVRCIIRSRPPVSTLYETILFIAGTAVLVCFLIELINRQRIALAVSTVLGALGMFLSMKYELQEAKTAGDTMPSLVAVLDTNFWLATHVTTVTMGYAAGLLAAAIAHVWIFGKILGGKDKQFFKSIARMTYGVICFGLVFSVVGTILGGIWANYSWGRFWGWDPKENGALLICLWMLLILHARMGGFIRDFGLAVFSIVCGLVVAFSWWGVNLLGVGLHSYGFTEGVGLVLSIFYGIEGAVLVLAGLWWLYQRGKQAALSGAGA